MTQSPSSGEPLLNPTPKATNKMKTKSTQDGGFGEGGYV